MPSGWEITSIKNKDVCNVIDIPSTYSEGDHQNQPVIRFVSDDVYAQNKINKVIFSQNLFLCVQGAFGNCSSIKDIYFNYDEAGLNLVNKIIKNEESKYIDPWNNVFAQGDRSHIENLKNATIHIPKDKENLLDKYQKTFAPSNHIGLDAPDTEGGTTHWVIDDTLITYNFNWAILLGSIFSVIFASGLVATFGIYLKEKRNKSKK